MSDLASGAMASVVDLAFDHKRTADTRTYRKCCEVEVVPADAEQFLCHSEGVHIVIDPHRNVDAFGQHLGKWQVLPAEARTLQADAAGGIDFARDRDADTTDFTLLPIGLGKQARDGRGDGLDHAFRGRVRHD